MGTAALGRGKPAGPLGVPAALPLVRPGSHRPSLGRWAMGDTPGHTEGSSCGPAPCAAGPEARATHALPRGTCVSALLLALLVPLAVAAAWVREGRRCPEFSGKVQEPL